MERNRRIKATAVWLPILLALAQPDSATMSLSKGGEKGLSIPDRPHTQVRYKMGTLFKVTVFGVNEDKADRAIDSAFDEIDRLDLLMSNYREESELSRVNSAAGKAPTKADTELLSVIDISLKYSILSRGAFDITVAPLMRAWRFFKAEGKLPGDEELSQALAGVGYSKVVLDLSAGTIGFTSPATELDLGAIGKGYAVDRAIDCLKKRGISRAVVDAGGNLYVLGDVPPDYSLVGIQHPRDDGIVAALHLRDAAVATSGDYEKFFTADGRRYSHIMDPRTGRPVSGTISATIVARSAVDADALSTTVYVLGLRDGLQLVESLPDVECLIISESSDGTLITTESSGWKMLTERKQ